MDLEKEGILNQQRQHLKNMSNTIKECYGQMSAKTKVRCQERVEIKHVLKVVLLQGNYM